MSTTEDVFMLSSVLNRTKFQSILDKKCKTSAGNQADKCEKYERLWLLVRRR